MLIFSFKGELNMEALVGAISWGVNFWSSAPPEDFDVKKLDLKIKKFARILFDNAKSSDPSSRVVKISLNQENTPVQVCNTFQNYIENYSSNDMLVEMCKEHLSYWMGIIAGQGSAFKFLPEAKIKEKLIIWLNDYKKFFNVQRQKYEKNSDVMAALFTRVSCLVDVIEDTLDTIPRTCPVMYKFQLINAMPRTFKDYLHNPVTFTFKFDIEKNIYFISTDKCEIAITDEKLSKYATVQFKQRITDEFSKSSVNKSSINIVWLPEKIVG